MTVEVNADPAIGPQAKTYAHYRLTAAIGELPPERPARHASLRLYPVHRDEQSGVACMIAVDFDRERPVRILVNAPHAYAAVNRAIDDLRAALTPGLVDRFLARRVS